MKYGAAFYYTGLGYSTQIVYISATNCLKALFKGLREEIKATLKKEYTNIIIRVNNHNLNIDLTKGEN